MTSLPMPHLSKRARLEILDQHIGVGQHLHQHDAAGVARQIKADRALVAIGADEISRVVVVKRRAPVTGLVAGRRFDLDDVGTVIGENLRAPGTAEHTRQIDHAQAGNGAEG